MSFIKHIYTIQGLRILRRLNGIASILSLAALEQPVHKDIYSNAADLAPGNIGRLLNILYEYGIIRFHTDSEGQSIIFNRVAAKHAAISIRSQLRSFDNVISSLEELENETGD